MKVNEMVVAQENGNIYVEAFAYTPGLKVKRMMVIEKTRRLPLRGDILVNVGQEVSYDTIVARTEVPGDPELVKFTNLLGIDEDEISDFLLKKEGDYVNADELIGKYSIFFGLIKREVKSPIDGEIEAISNITGQLIIRADPTPIEINAYLPGKIVEVMPREGVFIETQGAFIQGILGLGGEMHGELKVVVDSPEEELTADRITQDCKGCVVVGGSLIEYEAFEKAVKVGVSGLVAGGMNYTDVTKIMGEAIGVAITGEEKLGTTLIITEGFGKMNMSYRTFRLLKSFEGHMTAINGTTQIRAGVMRPEIIIPHTESVGETTGAELAAGMHAGTPVRIIRQPYFGDIGNIVNLPVELQRMESGSKVRVMVVKLEDGREVVVPRANVEIIEE